MYILDSIGTINSSGISNLFLYYIIENGLILYKLTGENINAQNNLGTTALTFATMYNKEKSVRLLLDHGASTSITDHEGKTALHYALEKDYISIVSLLR